MTRARVRKSSPQSSVKSRKLHVSNVTIRPATSADVAEMYPEGMAFSMRALAGEVDGKLLGVGGIMYATSVPVYVALKLKPEAKRYPIALVRAARRVKAMAMRLGVGELQAIADPDEPKAERFLEFMGFEHAGRHPKGELYKCKLAHSR